MRYVVLFAVITAFIAVIIAASYQTVAPLTSISVAIQGLALAVIGMVFVLMESHK